MGFRNAVVERGLIRVRGFFPSGAFALFIALLLGDLVYRIVLCIDLMRAHITPYSFVPNARRLGMLSRATSHDPLFVGSCGLGFAVIAVLLHAVTPTRMQRGLERLGFLLAGVITLVFGAVSATHLRVLFAMHTGFDASLVLEAVGSVSFREVLDYSEPSDFVVAFSPLLAFLVLARTQLRYPRLRFWVLGSCLLSFALAYFGPLWVSKNAAPETALRDPLLLPPVLYTSRDLIRSFDPKHHKFEHRALALPKPSGTDLFFDPDAGPLKRATTPKTRWNVLLVIMESTGARYVFQHVRNKVVPMPFLQKLRDRGLYLAQHYSTANTSPRAIFSIFTGLYPQPTADMFVTRPDIRIPGLSTALGHGYEHFFVTPGRLKSYMPLGMLENNGVHEVYGQSELPPQQDPIPGGGHNEIETADFFLARLAKAKEPFFATYYSYAPHFDYFDHGPQFRVLSDLSAPRNRYINSLRLLDTQIERFVTQLEKSGQLDRTVLVIVGDHGEAFGQHPGNFTHSRMSYEENLRVPALIVAPKLFKPRVEQHLTSHIDLLPTLLDAMQIPYEQNKLQGTSLLRDVSKRRYLYTWGNEGMLSSIDTTTRRKLQVSFETDECRYFDLGPDPNEQTRKKCGPETDEQLGAMLKYYRLQHSILGSYNASLAKDGSP